MTRAIRIIMAVLVLAVLAAEFGSGLDLRLLGLRLRMHDIRPALAALVLLYALLQVLTRPSLAGLRRFARRRRHVLLAAAALCVLVLAAQALRLRAAHVSPAVIPGASPVATAPGRQVIFIGLDAATLDVLEPLARAGRLPTISGLMKQGVYGRLQSVTSYRPWSNETGIWSPTVWTSIATGKLPFRHGVLDFRLPAAGDPGRLEAASPRHRRVKALWNMLSDLSVPSVIVGWWATWPAEEIRGQMVSSHVGLRGFPKSVVSKEGQEKQASLPGLTYPEALMEELRSRVPAPVDIDAFIKERFLDLEACRPREPRDLNAFRSVCFQDRYYTAIGRYLLKKEQPRFFFLYLEGTDVASHLFWAFRRGRPAPQGCDPGKLRSMVDAYYIYVDGIVGEVLAEAEPDATVVLLSDHGFKTVKQSPLGADHAPDGFFLFKGEGLKRGARLTYSPFLHRLALKPRAASILDIAPTILYLYGAPVGADFDGRVLAELFTPEFVEAHPVRTVQTYEKKRGAHAQPPPAAPELDKEYEDRLKALGYIQ